MGDDCISNLDSTFLCFEQYRRLFCLDFVDFWVSCSWDKFPIEILSRLSDMYHEVIIVKYGIIGDMSIIIFNRSSIGYLKGVLYLVSCSCPSGRPCSELHLSLHPIYMLFYFSYSCSAPLLFWSVSASISLSTLSPSPSLSISLTLPPSYSHCSVSLCLTQLKLDSWI